MTWLRQLVGRRQLARDLADEIDAHLAERTDELEAEGLPREEAHRRARCEFGNVTAIEERGREVWRWATLENLWSDLRYGARQLRGAPAFTLATVLTLALGIGVNSAVFSVIDAVLLRPLPFPQPDRLVSVAPKDLRGGPHPVSLCYPTFFDFRRDNRVFESMASFREVQLTLTGRGVPLALVTAIVSSEFFHLLSVPMARGRGFIQAEERPGTRVVVLSHAIWTTVFAEDPGIVGQWVTLDGRPFQVVGVTPPGFNFPLGRQIHVWTTLARDATGGETPVTEQRGARMLDAIARLAPGVSLAQAQAGMDVVAGAVARQYPNTNANLATTDVRPALDAIVASAWPPMAMLWGAVGLVLVIACANVANMLLVRTTDREREFGMRLAIGGSRGRVIQQLLAENLLLAATGSGAGVLMAIATLRFVVVPFAAGHVPRIEAVGLDPRLLAFAVFLAVCTALACSVPPALRIYRVDFVALLGGRSSRGSSDAHDRGRGLLVVAQIAVGLVLVSSAGVLVAGFIRLMNRDLGFEPRELLTFQTGLPSGKYSEEGRIAFTEQLLERLAAEPGVTAAAAAMPLPLEGATLRIAFDLDGRPSAPSRRPSSSMAIITPRYFATLGTAIVEGRDFTIDDDATSPPVAIVNEAFARRFFAGESARGRRFEPGATDRRGSVMREIVGVVANVRQSPLGPEPEPIYYLPLRQMTWGQTSFIVRTSVPPMTLEPSVRKLVAAFDKDVPLAGVKQMEELLSSGTSVPRFAVTLMSAFSMIAIVLIATGVYGLLTYAVLRRRRELGIRLALGATRRGVIALVLARAAKLTTTGLLVGIVGSVATARVFAHAFPESADPGAWLFPAAALIVSATSLLAAFLPAARAAAIDPTNALRRE